MNLALIGKVASSVLFSGGGIVGTAFIVFMYKSQITPLEETGKNIFIYTTSSSVESVEGQQKINTTNPNYICKFNSYKYDCKISKTKNFDEKKHLNITQLTEKHDNQAITTDELKIPDNIYEIEINPSIGDWSYKGTNIDIISKNSGQTFASLKPQFALDSSKQSINHTKTEYFVAKANSTISVATQFKEYKLISDNTPHDQEICNIYAFSDATSAESNIENLTFIGTVEEKTTLQQGKFYLLKLTTQTNKKITRIHKITTSNPATSEVVNLIDITMAIKVNKGIFLLKSNNPIT